MDFGLWTRLTVATFIQERFDMTLGVTVVGALLAKLGLTSQKPLQSAHQRDPAVHRPGQRRSVSAASAVDARGAMWYCTYQGALNGDRFIELLRKLLRGRKLSRHLVLDGSLAHKRASVRDFVASTNKRLTPHFLPGYAPDLNPDELAWSHVKRTGTARRPIRRGEKLPDQINAALHKLRCNRTLVRSFTRAPSVAYNTDC